MSGPFGVLLRRLIGISMLAVFGVCGEARAQDPFRIIDSLLENGRAGDRVIRRLGPGKPQRPAAPARSANPDEAPLSRSQMKQMQSALNSLGYDVGVADGKGGRRTGEAIADFLRQRGLDPYQTPVRSALRLVLQEALSTAGRAPTNTQAEQRYSLDEQLPSREMAEMQSALGRLGYEVGKADGKAGSKTAKAVASYLEGRGLDPNSTPVRQAYDLIVADSSGGPPIVESALQQAQQPAPFDTDSDGLIVDWTGGMVAFDGDNERFSRELLRRIAGARPDLLDNKRVMADWLSNLTRGAKPHWPAPEVVAAHEKYDGGTEFEQEEALSAFKAFLSKQAIQEPMNFVRIRRATVGRYDFDNQYFPLGMKSDSPWDLSDEMFLDWAGHPSVDVTVQGWEDIERLPFPRSEAEAFAAKLGSARYVDVAVNMVASGFSAVGDDIKADAKVLGISIYHGRPPKGKRLGALVSTLALPGQTAPAAAQVTAPAASKLESWTRLGASAADGRIILASQSNSLDEAAIASSIDLLALKKIGSVPVSISTALYYAGRYLDRPQFQSLVGGRGDDQFLYRLNQDQFAKRDIVKKFDEQYRPSLVSRAPELPVQARLSWRVLVGEYDFSGGSFPLHHGAATSGSSEVQLSVHPFPLPINLNLRGLPPALVLPESEARAVNTRLTAGQNRDAFAALDFTLQAFSASVKSTSLDIYLGSKNSDLEAAVYGAATHLALYEDAALTRKIADLSLAGFIDKSKIIAAAEPVEAAESKVVDLVAPTPVGDGASPESRFELLGLKLGMPLAEARTALSKRLGASAKPLESDIANIGSMSPCQSILVAGGAREELEPRLLSNDCEIPWKGPLEFAFGFEVPLSDKLSERIRIYATGSALGPQVVSAVYREFNGEVGTLLRDGLSQAYGKEFVVPANSDRVRVWVDHPDLSPLFASEGEETCLPFWIGGNSFPTKLRNCGAYIRADDYRMLLIDTRYVARAAAEQKIAAEAAKPKPPEIKF